MVAAGAADPVQLAQRRGELVERVVVVEGALDEPEALGEVPPDLLGERRPGVLSTASCTTLAKSSCSQSRRAKPTSEKPGGSSPRLARS